VELASIFQDYTEQHGRKSDTFDRALSYGGTLWTYG
jgi:hypothetical protein